MRAEHPSRKGQNAVTKMMATSTRMPGRHTGRFIAISLSIVGSQEMHNLRLFIKRLLERQSEKNIHGGKWVPQGLDCSGEKSQFWLHQTTLHNQSGALRGPRQCVHFTPSGPEKWPVKNLSKPNEKNIYTYAPLIVQKNGTKAQWTLLLVFRLITVRSTGQDSPLRFRGAIVELAGPFFLSFFSTSRWFKSATRNRNENVLKSSLCVRSTEKSLSCSNMHINSRHDFHLTSFGNQKRDRNSDESMSFLSTPSSHVFSRPLYLSAHVYRQKKSTRIHSWPNSATHPVISQCNTNTVARAYIAPWHAVSRLWLLLSVWAKNICGKLSSRLTLDKFTIFFSPVDTVCRARICVRNFHSSEPRWYWRKK